MRRLFQSFRHFGAQNSLPLRPFERLAAFQAGV
jgi:hypothetical protein